jgi:hypothetical protein
MSIYYRALAATFAAPATPEEQTTPGNLFIPFEDFQRQPPKRRRKTPGVENINRRHREVFSVGSVPNDGHLVDHHVVAVFGVVDANFAVLSDPLGFNLFALRINISDGFAELIMNGFARA